MPKKKNKNQNKNRFSLIYTESMFCCDVNLYNNFPKTETFRFVNK